MKETLKALNLNKFNLNYVDEAAKLYILSDF